MKLYGTWEVFVTDDERHEWNPDDVTVGEEVTILGELAGTGIGTYEAWIDAIDERRPIPVQVLVWFLRVKAGRQEERAAVNIAHRRVELTRVKQPPDFDSASDDPKPETST